MKHGMRIVMCLGMMMLQQTTFGCSCDRIYFCDYLNRPEPTAAFMGEVVGSVVYSEQSEAVYVKVLETLRDDFGLTDTIKLYGRSSEASCDAHVTNRYPVGHAFYWAIGEVIPPESNPDSSTEQYFETRLWLCSLITLRLTDEGALIGPISGDTAVFGRRGLNEYPHDGFKEDLPGCSFSLERLERSHCELSTFTLYPNPATNGYFRLRFVYNRFRYDRVRIFSIDGRLLLDQGYQRNGFGNDIYVHEWPPGMYIVEVTSGKVKVHNKLVVQ